MGETIKTVVLIILIVNSIVMTGYIWMQNYHYEQAGDQYLEEISYGDPPSLFEQVSPEKIVYYKDTEDAFILADQDESKEQSANQLEEELYDRSEQFDIEGTYQAIEAPVDLILPGEQVYGEAWDILEEVLIEEVRAGDYYVEQEEIEITTPYLVYRFSDISLPNLLWEDEVFFPYEEELEYKDILLTFDVPPEVYLVNYEEQTGYALNLNISYQKISQLEETLAGNSFESAFPITAEWMEQELVNVGMREIEHFVENKEMKEAYLQAAEEEVAAEEAEEAEEAAEAEEEKEETEVEAETGDDRDEEAPEDQEPSNGEEEAVANQVKPPFYQQAADSFEERAQFDKEGLRFYLPGEAFEIAPKEVIFETLDEEKLAKAFFLDLSYVRRIEERDGTSIFTDGQQGLRFYPNGAVQYDDPRVEAKREPLSPEKSLEHGANFISMYGGWKDNLRIANVNMPEENSRDFTDDGADHTTLIYEYFIEGVPIINYAPLEIVLSGHELVAYTRHLPVDYEAISLNENGGFISFGSAFQSWLEARFANTVEEVPQAENYEEVIERYQEKITMIQEEMNELKRIYLGYYFHEAENLLYPVWTLEFEGDQRLKLPAWDSEELKDRINREEHAHGLE